MAKHKRNHNKVSRNITGSMPTTNRNYKDTIFRMLFSDRKNLLSLYNAVNQRDYQNPEDLEIVTLENAIYMGMKNDLAFILDTNLYLYEHQSTYNPNMPLRDLFFICSEYQKLVDHKSLYSSAFENLSGEPKFELIVTVLNINDGHNADLMHQCSILHEYAQYVARVRHYAGSMPLNDAVERAVDECIREGILTEFLSRNRNEVISMSIFEYDKELEEKKLRKAEFEAGFSEGMKLNSIETAKRMLKLQEFSLEKISAITGLPFDEVKKLQANEARSDS